MILCQQCQDFDIRSLLLTSAAQTPALTHFLYTTTVNDGYFRPALPYFYKHHESITDLKRCAENGTCEVCDLFWKCCFQTLKLRTDISNEQLDEIFPGQVYIGTSNWSTNNQGYPYITLSQISTSGAVQALCSIEAFSDIQNTILQTEKALLGRAVSTHSSSTECMLLATEWLQTCLKDHAACAVSSRTAKLPTRLIDVGDSTRDPRLVTTSGDIGTWIALSYCWGGDSEFVYNDSKKEALEDGIRLSGFPQTLQDAILITRELGLQYVWIDALCIKQDSAEDWTKEAARMKNVYSGAVLTIVAANSPSTRTGIFHKRETGMRAGLEWRYNNQDTANTPQLVHLRPGNELWDHSLQKSTLMTRGWTLQEGLLAPRTLSFGSQQMVWECCQHQAEEGGRITKASEIYRSKGFIQQLIHNDAVAKGDSRRSLVSRVTSSVFDRDPWYREFAVEDPCDLWEEIVNQFMARSLTNDKDVLPALAGIASVFQPLLKDNYLAGMWERELLSQLKWSRAPPKPYIGTDRFDSKRKSGYLAPSWSWASVHGRMSVIGSRERHEREAGSVAKILNVHTVPEGPDQFGRVVSGQLVLRARFCNLEYMPPTYSQALQRPKDYGGEPRNTSPFQQLIYSDFCTAPEMIYERYQQHEECPEQRFAAIELSRQNNKSVQVMWFLILESTGKPNKWRRISIRILRKLPVIFMDATNKGVNDIQSQHNDVFDEVVKENWKKRVVTIV